MAFKREYRKIFGETVRARRKALDMSQEKLAEKAELHHNYIGEVERGEKAATIDTIVKIANALGIRARDLFCDV
ncbi:MAG TPA: helix-turn-helix transcriptional regulator [Candidatus Binatia bacterium]|nr:helix-turn-helix transcriptional regulator [Candidatus Binatia bacterium]